MLDEALAGRSADASAQWLGFVALRPGLPGRGVPGDRRAYIGLWAGWRAWASAPAVIALGLRKAHALPGFRPPKEPRAPAAPGFVALLNGGLADSAFHAAS